VRHHHEITDTLILREIRALAANFDALVALVHRGVSPALGMASGFALISLIIACPLVVTMTHWLRDPAPHG